MIGEILCVGTELLLGDIINTNAAFLARELAALGISVYHQTVVGDNGNRLCEAVKLALSRSDLLRRPRKLPVGEQGVQGQMDLAPPQMAIRNRRRSLGEKAGVESAGL